MWVPECMYVDGLMCVGARMYVCVWIDVCGCQNVCMWMD